MPWTRREFIVATLQLGGSLFVSRAFAGTLAGVQKRKTVFVLGDNEKPLQYDRVLQRAVPHTGSVSVVDPESGVISRIPAPMVAHGFAQSPVEPTLVVGVEKWTDQAGAFDLREKKMVHPLKAPADLRFFGHAAFDPTGQFLFVSAARGPMPESVLVVFDRKTWKPLRVVNTGSINPHEVSLDPTGKFLLMTNLTEAVTLSVPEGKVLRRYPTGPGKHILWLDSGSVVLGGRSQEMNGKVATHLSLLNLASGKETNFRDGMPPDAEIQGELLSMACFDDDRIIGTVPDSKFVLLWNFRANTLISQKIRSPFQGVVRYGDHIYANMKSNGHKAELNLTPRQQIHAERKQDSWGKGSHIYSFEIPA